MVERFGNVDFTSLDTTGTYYNEVKLWSVFVPQSDQIGNFLNNWHDVTLDKREEAETKRQQLAHAIENSKSIAQLAGNPLLIQQWDVEGNLLEKFPGLSDEIGLRETTDILRTVAYAMETRLSDKSRANYIDGTTLTSLIEDYLHTELRFD